MNKDKLAFYKAKAECYADPEVFLRMTTDELLSSYDDNIKDQDLKDHVGQSGI